MPWSDRLGRRTHMLDRGVGQRDHERRIKIVARRRRGERPHGCQRGRVEDDVRVAGTGQLQPSPHVVHVMTTLYEPAADCTTLPDLRLERQPQPIADRIVDGTRQRR